MPVNAPFSEMCSALNSFEIFIQAIGPASMATKYGVALPELTLLTDKVVLITQVTANPITADGASPTGPSVWRGGLADASAIEHASWTYSITDTGKPAFRDLNVDTRYDPPIQLLPEEYYYFEEKTGVVAPAQGVVIVRLRGHIVDRSAFNMAVSGATVVPGALGPL